MSPKPVTAPSSVPTHVAIIMDGNGRWAQARGLPRTAGHKQGAEAVRRTLIGAAELGVKYLTLFGFSAENWRRPESEVSALMGLLRLYLRSEIAELHGKGARLRVIGDVTRFDPDILALIRQAEELTRHNTKINLTIALSYGGRQEITAAARMLAQEAAAGRLDPSHINEALFETCLTTAGMPDPDLLIRTSGEKRISNFLLWQSAYAELIFVDTLWPDFDRRHLEEAIVEYNRRERRFGVFAGAR
ncbi:MAG: isoprenyl transferase [Alphaproteobacteria bacterium]|nr:isoprenyl transferase [Alphaproteobacteria bacterium]